MARIAILQKTAYGPDTRIRSQVNKAADENAVFFFAPGSAT